MNTIVSIRARARARALPVNAKHGIAALVSVTSATPPATPVRSPTLRASWSLDPMSGRLECRWAADDEEPGTRVSSQGAVTAWSQAA
ncbi:hypothetical protein MCBMB27_05281 [Methylobacterium phyllosphaerae]|uniref:Uncharacterized protein n=1 Tax=Methylobacterium phyllosphaerae TaxID=418223 RepID=A0AAE8L7M0_9HYPH|nr:hypothetical protein MCBMB27_05281 [Methylobacterium phyllosphaerae]SFH18982.1 hypothetical protein SAMN05192567_11616 [Methylobacterium phyllosphaerae]